MRLKELFEPKQSIHNVKAKDSPFYKYREMHSQQNNNDDDDDAPKVKSPDNGNKLVKVLGRGNFAAAVANENKPGEVNKVSDIFGNEHMDGYYQFLNTIINNRQMQDNPYFPKVYKIKVYKTQDDHYFYIVQMEKLRRLDELDEREITMLASKMFKNGSTITKLSAIINLLKNSVETRSGIARIKDENLKDAVNTLKDLGLRDFGNDIKESNLMFRRTSVGPQLVITDPVV